MSKKLISKEISCLIGIIDSLDKVNQASSSYCLDAFRCIWMHLNAGIQNKAVGYIVEPKFNVKV